MKFSSVALEDGKRVVTRPGQDPAPFLAAGRIEALDLVQRTLRVGREEFAVSSDVNLEGLVLGTVVMVSGVRDASTGRAVVQHIVRPLAATPPKGEADRASDRPSARALLALVVALLSDIRGAIQTLECEVLPLDRYAIRLRIPGEVGKEILLPRRVLERALVDPTARRRMRNILIAAAEMLRSQRAISTAREVRHLANPEAFSRMGGPRCARCGSPLFAEDAVVVQDTLHRHLACPSW